jgi:hypothetical protein
MLRAHLVEHLSSNGSSFVFKTDSEAAECNDMPLPSVFHSFSQFQGRCRAAL